MECVFPKRSWLTLWSNATQRASSIRAKHGCSVRWINHNFQCTQSNPRPSNKDTWNTKTMLHPLSFSLPLNMLFLTVCILPRVWVALLLQQFHTGLKVKQVLEVKIELYYFKFQTNNPHTMHIYGSLNELTFNAKVKILKSKISVHKSLKQHPIFF